MIQIKIHRGSPLVQQLPLTHPNPLLSPDWAVESPGLREAMGTNLFQLMHSKKEHTAAINGVTGPSGQLPTKYTKP